MSPNVLDNSLSAVKTSPPPVIKTQLQETLLSFLPVERLLRKTLHPRAVLGRKYFPGFNALTRFPLKRFDRAVHSKQDSHREFGFVLSLIGPHKILFTDSVQRELSKYCRKSEYVHCGNVLLINALWHSYEVRKKP